MNDRVYTMLLLRRRFCKRVALLITIFGISFYGTVLLFGTLRTPHLLSMSDLNKCPACYGISVCAELYSDQIILEYNGHWLHMFNAKNIYYGFTKSNRRVIIKKLAHDWELKKFDSDLCKHMSIEGDCKPSNFVKFKNVDSEILKLVTYNLTWPGIDVRKGLVMCPYAALSIYDFIQPALQNQAKMVIAKINIWTMLSVNPEPIVLQVIPKSKGWPVPAYGGVCGRLEVLGYEGEPLSDFTHVAWHRRLNFAKQLMQAAMDFTFKHDRYRFYLMDWSLDNIVVNEKDKISFIDLEDVVILDKHIVPQQDLPKWFQRYGHESFETGFSFSIDSLCKHHLSDHNIWAACYIIAGEESSILLPIPEDVNASYPNFKTLMEDCLHNDNRFNTVLKMQEVMASMLKDDKVVGFGGVG